MFSTLKMHWLNLLAKFSVTECTAGPLRPPKEEFLRSAGVTFLQCQSTVTGTFVPGSKSSMEVLLLGMKVLRNHAGDTVKCLFAVQFIVGDA